MKTEDPITKVKLKLAALREDEKRLQQEIKGMGLRIREDIKPTALIKTAVSGMFRDRNTIAETATAALGLGAGLLARSAVRKQQSLSLMGKAGGLAVGFLLNKFLQRKRQKKLE